jgi:hypothetical protein
MPLDVDAEEVSWPIVVAEPLVVQEDGVTVTASPKINFGAGIDAIYNAAEGRTDVTVTGVQAANEKGQANGYAGLGPDGKVPPGQLPEASAGLATPLMRSLDRRYRFRLELLAPEPIFNGSLAVGQTSYWFHPMRVDGILDTTVNNATYYSWSSTDHDARFAVPAPGGVYLQTANSPVGPWSDRMLLFRDTDIISGQANMETETPSVVYVPDDSHGRPFYCFYQVQDPAGASQFTRMRSHSSGDTATGWTQEPVRNLLSPQSDWSNNRLRIGSNREVGNQQHTGYFNVFQHGSRAYAYSRLGGSAAFGFWSSLDLINWHLDPHWVRYNITATNNNDQYLAPTQVHPFMWGGQLYTLTTLASKGGVTPSIRTPVIVPMSQDFRSFVGRAQPILTPTQDWEVASQVTAIQPFQDGGVMYVYVTYASVKIGIYQLVEN